MPQDQIRITATPVTDNSCRFTVDRPVYPESSFYFGKQEKAAGSDLASRLFAIEGVTAVLISHDEITVNKGAQDPWQTVGPKIGAAIREHIASGEPAVSDETRRNIPSVDEIRARVEEILESEINPSVASHGGVVHLLDVRENNLFIQMGGGCQGCGSAKVTLKYGVEAAIRQAIPEVGAILDVTDHAAGRNPYYAAQGH
ncbi:MAG: NifU family protein [Planctomycetota bacterium]